MRALAILLPLAALVAAMGCGGVTQQWRDTYQMAGALDAKAERLITDQDYWRVYRFRQGGKDIYWNLCGPARLRQFCKGIGSQCVITRGNRTYIYNLAGPLPNGRVYVSQWGAGHEWSHVIGLDVDHLMEGL